MIEFVDVRFAYSGSGAFALHVPALTVSPGERVALIGPSGSGKSTLLLLAGGVLLPASGSVRLASDDLTRVAASRRRRLRLYRIGMVFQEFELLEYLTVRENITLAGRLDAGIDARSLAVEAERLATAAGVAALLDRKPAALSQGERQRVAACRALATRPAALLCDEPTGNLDPTNADIVTRLLLDHARDHRAALLMSTHRHESLDAFDRVVDIAAFRRDGETAR
ncbi:MAG: ABC transporter ATP-binding protein [Phycisphaerales bacterium]